MEGTTVVINNCIKNPISPHYVFLSVWLIFFYIIFLCVVAAEIESRIKNTGLWVDIAVLIIWLFPVMIIFLILL